MPHSKLQPNIDIPRRIFWTLIGSGLAAISAIVTLSYWMSQEANELALENSEQLVQTAIAAEIDRISIQVEDYANWDEALDWVEARDDESVYANIGTGATEGPGFDMIYLLGPDRGALYAFADGGVGSDLTLFAGIDLTQLLNDVGTLPLAPYQTRTTVTLYTGDITILAAGRLQPFEADGIEADDLPLFVGASVLTAAELQQLGHDMLLSNVRAVRANQLTGSAPVPGFALNASDGTPVAYLTWDAPTPGNQMLARAVPVIAVTSLLLLLGSTFIGRASAAQTKDFLTERNRARTDTLTGLLNRAGLTDKLREPDIAQAISKGHAAVVYLDINDFKVLNDTVGHDGGDAALRTMADRLRRSMRHADAVARLGGDEFVAVLVDPSPEQAATLVCERILLQAELPVRIGKTDHTIKPAIGVAVSDRKSDWDDLLIRADAAMYRAKRSSSDAAVFFYDPGAETSRPISTPVKLAAAL